MTYNQFVNNVLYYDEEEMKNRKIVRCKNCKYWNGTVSVNPDFVECTCFPKNNYRHKDAFCDRGEKK